MRTETEIREEIEGLQSLTTAQLKEKYHEVFGEQSRSNHKQFLFRRIAWRIQANAWGGLSERARQRALEIADDADLRIRAPKNFFRQPIDDGRTIEARLNPALDPRLPLPGTPLIRRFQGKDIIVHVRPDGGFECKRETTVGEYTAAYYKRRAQSGGAPAGLVVPTGSGGNIATPPEQQLRPAPVPRR